MSGESQLAAQNTAITANNCVLSVQPVQVSQRGVNADHSVFVALLVSKKLMHESQSAARTLPSHQTIAPSLSNLFKVPQTGENSDLGVLVALLVGEQRGDIAEHMVGKLLGLVSGG